MRSLFRSTLRAQSRGYLSSDSFAGEGGALTSESQAVAKSLAAFVASGPARKQNFHHFGFASSVGVELPPFDFQLSEVGRGSEGEEQSEEHGARQTNRT